MQTMKEKNGHYYSVKEFPEYNFRYKFIAHSFKGHQLINTDVYTTNENKKEVEELLINRAQTLHEGVDKNNSCIVNTSTKEQDEATARFLDEILKDW